jgi:hypothetical protein
LLLLATGGIVTGVFGRALGELGFVLLWATVIATAYMPLARVRCQKCKKFPFKSVINIGGMPLLCFWPRQKCGHCGEDMVVLAGDPCASG